MQFKLTDLMRLTVYFAVGAWLYSLNHQFGVGYVWLGTVFGFEVGRRSSYPTPLMAICGSVFGLALWSAIVFTGYETSATKLFMFMGLTSWHFLLAVVWFTAIAIFLWIVTRIDKSTAPSKTGSH